MNRQVHKVGFSWRGVVMTPLSNLKHINMRNYNKEYQLEREKRLTIESKYDTIKEVIHRLIDSVRNHPKLTKIGEPNFTEGWDEGLCTFEKLFSEYY